MKLLAGLGNPGKEYEKNRHNIGFMAVDDLCNYYGLKQKKKLHYFYAWQRDNLLVKPRTYMNNSGKVLAPLIRKNKFDDVMVVSDDINLEIGEIRLRQEGGIGGHNGLGSIVRELGSDQFKRLRIGVGNPREQDLRDYVLSDFTAAEENVLREILEFTRKLLNEYLEYDYEKLLNYYSRNKKSYSEMISSLRIAK
ncbi:MAG: aminoacyl-tRNA hydrolase [Candidatus Cloacimonetes bacterium]|nr:aminoacyl-tRNA hydrolase [Candidatus Cloacimonadota bacterium]